MKSEGGFAAPFLFRSSTMPMLKATRTVRYGRIEYKAGETFEASDKDARVLIAIKKAVFGPASMPGPAIVDRQPAPAAPKAEEPAPVPFERPRRQYRRRDMRAED